MATKKEIELCQEILALAVAINSHGKHSVWAEFHGHVNSFEVRITPKYFDHVECIDGWGCADRMVYLSHEGERLYGETKKENEARKAAELAAIRLDLADFLSREVSK